MNNIQITKTKLISILKKNRNEHYNIFLKAQEGYKKKVIELLENMLEEARKSKNGSSIKTSINIIAPVNQTNDYDVAIRMLELDENKKITLSYQDYLKYVEDEWGWSRSFAFSNAPYSDAVGASPKLSKYLQQ